MAFVGILLLLGALSHGCRPKKTGAAVGDASVEGGALFDADLPETVVVYLDAGTDAAKPSSASRYVTLLSGLPTPCQDTSKKLGLVTFSQSGDDVIITSSKTKARATCTVKDPHTLLCDWVGTDGKPSVQKAVVTYGPNKPIGGAYDKTHRFACKTQR